MFWFRFPFRLAVEPLPALLFPCLHQFLVTPHACHGVARQGLEKRIRETSSHIGLVIGEDAFGRERDSLSKHLFTSDLTRLAVARDGGLLLEGTIRASLSKADRIQQVDGVLRVARKNKLRNTLVNLPLRLVPPHFPSPHCEQAFQQRG
ncbi:MAG: hypothetical protein GX547_09300 [Phycisphaerae bacterium]|nr:hypothetical protein [Phycisphaerae bacterium]